MAWTNADALIIGGGLAGSEFAWQLATRGFKVELYEMRPGRQTGAHTGDQLAELVCSNSLGSKRPDRAQGLLQEELRMLGSLLIDCALQTTIPAGRALAVDRDAFSQLVTHKINENPNIHLLREEVNHIPSRPAIIATGPLTSPAMASAIQVLTGNENLYFFDAIAPIVLANTINMDIAFRASRYGSGEPNDGDYINCPFTREQYYEFTTIIANAERIALAEFERSLEMGVNAGNHQFYEGCLPVEILARRGERTLAFGPMRPVGLFDPHTNSRPYAVVQLRQDNIAASLYNLVGFQTNLTYSEQQRVFRMIPGLEKAEFVRFGQMHKNTFIFSPSQLMASLQHKQRKDLFFAGQITGVEGYVGNIGTGLLAGINLARVLDGVDPIILSPETMLGALCHYVANASPADFQPMKANYGLLPTLSGISGVENPNNTRSKSERAALYRERSLQQVQQIIN